MDHAPVFRIYDLGYTDTFVADGDPSQVVNLTTARRVKRALAKDQGRTRLLSQALRGSRCLLYNRVELKQIRLIVVETFGHIGERTKFMKWRGRSYSRPLLTRGQECPRHTS